MLEKIILFISFLYVVAMWCIAFNNYFRERKETIKPKKKFWREQIMTWIQLFDKIGKQMIKRTKKTATIWTNGKKYEAKLVFTNSGQEMHLELGKEITE